MAKRRKRRRIAWINRLNSVMKENPGMSIEEAKIRTEEDVRAAVRRADWLANTKDEHLRILEDTLENIDKPKDRAPKVEEKVEVPVIKKIEPQAPKIKKAVAKPKTKKTVAKAKPTTTKSKKASTKKTTTRKKSTRTKSTKKA